MNGLDEIKFQKTLFNKVFVYKQKEYQLMAENLDQVAFAAKLIHIGVKYQKNRRLCHRFFFTNCFQKINLILIE